MIRDVCKMTQTFPDHDMDTEWYTIMLDLTFDESLHMFAMIICEEECFHDTIYPSPWLLVYHSNG